MVGGGKRYREKKIIGLLTAILRGKTFTMIYKLCSDGADSFVGSGSIIKNCFFLSSFYIIFVPIYRLQLMIFFNCFCYVEGMFCYEKWPV